jgi:hypothetical protein
MEYRFFQDQVAFLKCDTVVGLEKVTQSAHPQQEERPGNRRKKRPPVHSATRTRSFQKKNPTYKHAVYHSGSRSGPRWLSCWDTGGHLQPQTLGFLLASQAWSSLHGAVQDGCQQQSTWVPHSCSSFRPCRCGGHAQQASHKRKQMFFHPNRPADHLSFRTSASLARSRHTVLATRNSASRQLTTSPSSKLSSQVRRRVQRPSFLNTSSKLGGGSRHRRLPMYHDRVKEFVAQEPRQRDRDAVNVGRLFARELRS